LVENVFDLELIMAIANSNPAISFPQESLQHLLGPWLEMRGARRYAVSPLVRAAGLDNLNNVEKSAVRRSIIHSLIGRAEFPVDQLLPLLIAALVERSTEGLVWFVNMMLHCLLVDSSMFTVLAYEIQAFAYFPTESQFLDDEEYFSVMLRIIQVFVAQSVGADCVQALFLKALAECKSLEDKVLSANLLLLLVGKILMRRTGEVSPDIWLPVLLEIKEWRAGSPNLGTAINTLLIDESAKTSWTAEQFLFVCQATSLPDIKSLKGFHGFAPSGTTISTLISHRLAFIVRYDLVNEKNGHSRPLEPVQFW
jgi:hypothetical protein